MNVNHYLEALQADKTLLIINLVAALLAGAVLLKVLQGLKDMWYDWRDSRAEEEAELDSTRIMAGLYPDRYEETETNENYFQRTTDGKGFRLNDRWRELIAETRPRSPEMVAEAVYREDTYQFSLPRAESNPPIDPEPWPINEPYTPWTEEEKQQPGRHRSTEEEDTAQRRVLLTQTGSFKALGRRELTRV